MKIKITYRAEDEARAAHVRAFLRRELPRAKEHESRAPDGVHCVYFRDIKPRTKQDRKSVV